MSSNFEGLEQNFTANRQTGEEAALAERWHTLVNHEQDRLALGKRHEIHPQVLGMRLSTSSMGDIDIVVEGPMRLRRAAARSMSTDTLAMNDLEATVKGQRRPQDCEICHLQQLHLYIGRAVQRTRISGVWEGKIISGAGIRH